MIIIRCSYLLEPVTCNSPNYSRVAQVLNSKLQNFQTFEALKDTHEKAWLKSSQLLSSFVCSLYE